MYKSLPLHTFLQVEFEAEIADAAYAHYVQTIDLINKDMPQANTGWFEKQRDKMKERILALDDMVEQMLDDV